MFARRIIAQTFFTGACGALVDARRGGAEAWVNVVTGDAAALPSPSGRFDAVVSHGVLHNLQSATDRTRALNEMLRVLRPGGILVLADIAHHAEYREPLTARGFADIRVETGGINLPSPVF